MVALHHEAHTTRNEKNRTELERDEKGQCCGINLPFDPRCRDF